MKEKWPTIVVLVAVGLVLLTFLVVFQVRANEMAVHRRWRQVLRVINAGDRQDAGWYFKLPMYAGWRITDPVKFENALKGDEKVAQITIRDKIQDATSQTVGKFTLDHLVSTDPEKLKFAEIEQCITDLVHEGVQEGDYGVDICSFGIRRIAIPQETTEKVFERMRSERRSYATQYRAEGRRIKTEKIEEAKTVREKTIADAIALGKRLRSEGDEAEARYFSTFAKAPDLANFLRGLEALSKIAEEAKKNNQPITFVIDTKTVPFDLLEQGAGGTGYLAEEEAAELTAKIADALLEALSEGGSSGSDVPPPSAEVLLRRLRGVSERTKDPKLAMFVDCFESLVSKEVTPQAEGSAAALE